MVNIISCLLYSDLMGLTVLQYKKIYATENKYYINYMGLYTTYSTDINKQIYVCNK